MRFFNPINLLWILPMAGSIVLMYILKLRRRDVVVSSTFLWSQVVRDVQANAPFQKLRKNLLLLLQLIAITLLVLAVGRPFFRSSGLGGRSVVIVVDTSASMQSTDVPGGRLEAAKTEARRLVNEMRPEDQVIVVTAAAKPEALTGFSSDRGELLRAINEIRAKQTTTNMRDSLNLAAALVSARDASQIDIISDGGFTPITSVNLGKTNVVFHPVGKGGKNVGITAVDYRRNLTGDKKLELFVTVRNFDREPRTFNVEIGDGPNLIDAHELTLKPGAEESDIFEMEEPEKPLAINVKLDVKDDLESDNQAPLLITPRRIVKTLLVTNDNLFLKTGINVDPNVQLSVVKPADFGKPDGYDVVIFDGRAPANLPEANYFFINCTSDQSPVEVGDSSENRSLIDPDKNHPVMRYVDFGQNRWTSMRRGAPRGWAQELGSSEAGPAIVAGEKNKMRALWTGFHLDVEHSTFPLSVGFPIFVTNAIRWLARAEETADAQIRTGRALSVDAPASAKTLTITKPSGAKRSVVVSAKGNTVFDEVDEVGIYMLSGEGGFSRQVAANLADPAESDILPKKSSDISGNPSGQVGRMVTSNRELWPYVAAVLIALLLFEWWAFHRRVHLA